MRYDPYTLNLIDLSLTLYALHHGGVELNPLMRSIPVMVGWKVVGVAPPKKCQAETKTPAEAVLAKIINVQRRILCVSPQRY